MCVCASACTEREVGAHATHPRSDAKKMSSVFGGKRIGHTRIWTRDARDKFACRLGSST
jgi:hypothetical protein